MLARPSCLALAFGALIALGSVQSQAAEVEISTARDAAQFANSPQHVVVMDVAALDTIDALGIVPVGVPDKLFVSYLDHLTGKAEGVGSLFEPNFEAINALQPDLVVVGGRSSAQYDQMSKLVPTIDMTIPGTDIVAQARVRLEDYGKLFGKEQKASELEAAFDAKLAEAKTAVAGKGNGLIILTNGPKISAYGATGRFGWLHEAIGLPEAVTSIEEATHGEAISFEFIRDADPDWLLVVDRSAAIGASGASAQATLDNALVHETKAWKKQQIVYLDAANIYIASGGVQSMSHTLDEVIAAFSKADPS
ncbi:siderophore ABC transporter substrate-binding protein [uncultured Cohaesibacter sp.]|uniref:siderophore ABC transporter substrate-binding protein n=1 Tax=uncultured Cohaesibacter sp. TaxID=1002546 RepID=UPI0029C982F6|nr:siderophore ABC transporter substrate-binding protein [uncultured Cohaesibacter sp.]